MNLRSPSETYARDAGNHEACASTPLGPPAVVNDREAMGYGPGYVHARLPDHDKLAEMYRDLSADELINVLDDASATLEQRIGAGTRLNQIGDIRLDVQSPNMIALPAASAKIGLARDQIDIVLSENDGLFLERSWIEKECPEHRIDLDRFAIGKYPVTNAEYMAFLCATKSSEIPSSWRFGRYPSSRGNHPVYSVSPAGAENYAAWLADLTGRKFRLPTEAEWEYAASGPDHLEFPWGDIFQVDRSNTAESGLFTTTPVGCFPNGVSPFGVHDLAGNVEELVADVYRAYPGGAEIHDDLALAFTEGYRVARGGSFTRFRDLTRTRRRHGAFPREIYVIGFRLAETLS